MRLGLVLALLPATGCLTLFPQRIKPAPMLFAAAPATVFVADGAGDYQMLTIMLRTVTQKDGYPFDIVLAHWSHGTGRILADQLDYPHVRDEGANLAMLVQTYRAAQPDRPLFLVGHSAGAAVVLAALENLPPGVVERAVLLAPAVSDGYDVRRALCAVKQDIHVFYSSRDTLFLGTTTALLGTADRRRGPASGVVGFRPAPNEVDPCTLKKLIQHPWQSTDRRLGNNGGHFGAYQPDFMRLHILPLLQ